MYYDRIVQNRRIKMLKAYSIYRDFIKEACDIIKEAGIEVELSN